MNFTFHQIDNQVARLKYYVPGTPLYQVRCGTTVVGYVQKQDAQWCAWNSHRDFWAHFADTRVRAVEQMRAASWIHFIRADAVATVEA